MPYIYILIGLGLVALLICKVIYDRKTLDQRLEQELKDAWGQVPTQEYSFEKMESIPKFYHSQKDKEHDVDDITWNDLDMDRVFMLINHTESSIGEEYLYSVLRKLQFSSEQLKERDRLADFFSTHPKERKLVQKKLKMMGRLKDISFYEYINRVDALEPHKPYLHVLCMFLLPLSILTIFIPAIGNYGFGIMAAALAFNITMYYRRKAKIEKYFTVFSYILRSLAFMKELADTNIPELNTYFEEMRGQIKRFNKFKRGSSLVVSRNISGSPEEVLLDNLRMIFHFDLIKFDFMVDELRDKKENLNRLFEIIGILDTTIAIASFRELMLQEYCKPEFSKSDTGMLVEDVYHPLIINPVKNSIVADKSILLTGSNASGKSTFIKTIAINAILAQTIFTSLSKRYKCCYYKVYSSMALRDDIMSQESYYIVEIKSLKRIYDASNDKLPILCFIDEVLRGTNTAERIAASSQILKALSSRNALVFAATHDIELTNILQSYYADYHFEEKIENNQVLFDYILRKGKATTRNAIKLLGMMGYSDDIIKRATEEVNHFLKTNSWSTI